jgi:drug/metabolite transporter (DMT)-like permease
MSEYEALLGKKRLEKQEQHWFWDSWILLALSATCCFATSNLMIDHLAVKHGMETIFYFSSGAVLLTIIYFVIESRKS